jgi:MFS family permease
LRSQPSRAGDGLYTAAVAWLAWTLTYTTGAVALVAANAPTLALSLVGASYADRYDRRRLMIATDPAELPNVAMIAVDSTRGWSGRPN